MHGQYQLHDSKLQSKYKFSKSIALICYNNINLNFHINMQYTNIKEEKKCTTNQCIRQSKNVLCNLGCYGSQVCTNK